ncbi:squalene--hopene cyclase, partial [bacterium]|nr:squalene--hopene cyclase [bacterium]
MQNRDGGWGAFDKDIDQEFLTKVPFADHNAMLDPTCPDISARVLEALGSVGIMQDNINVRNAINYIRTTQETWGAWIGRWGVNYIYGTWQVLQGLNAVGFDSKDPMIQKAVAWLKNIQQPNGAWGETCATYDDPTLAGTGTPTPSQTAWAILGLLSAGEHKSEAVRRGINYLVRTQRPDGNWDELHHTGTGFPKVFYLKYHYYRLYFPLMALSRFLRKQGYECVV